MTGAPPEEIRLSDLAPNSGPLVELIADPSCPWCYVGFRRLVRLQQTGPFVLRWRPFLLNPYLPPEGIDRETYVARKLGGADAARRLQRRIAEAGRRDGVLFEFDRIARTPNTLLAHALLLEAQRRGRLVACAELLFRTFFRDGGDIGDPVLLARAARFLELPRPEDTLRAREAIVASHQAATEAGVTGVPVFLFGGAHTVAGAQPPEVLAAMLDLDRYRASLPTPAATSP
jgi:predicted DsbA family dithiol-disulfide isomerase